MYEQLTAVGKGTGDSWVETITTLTDAGVSQDLVNSCLVRVLFIRLDTQWSFFKLGLLESEPTLSSILEMRDVMEIVKELRDAGGMKRAVAKELAAQEKVLFHNPPPPKRQCVDIPKSVDWTKAFICFNDSFNIDGNGVRVADEICARHLIHPGGCNPRPGQDPCTRKHELPGAGMQEEWTGADAFWVLFKEFLKNNP